MGRNVWMGLFLLVPIGQAIPLHELFPVYYPLAALILLYWCLLVAMGYARFTWRKLPGADLLVFLFMIYMTITFFRHPASNALVDNLFGLKNAYIPVIEYPLCIATIIFYVAYSCIPIDNKRFVKVIKWGVIINMALLFISGIENLRSADLSVEDTRFGMFNKFAYQLLILSYASIPHNKLFTSPHLLSILFSLLIMIISGFRKNLIYFCYYFAWIAVIKRDFLTIATCLILAMLTLFFINTSSILDRLPFSAQRVLSIIPGMNVKQAVKTSGQNSSEWRYVIWKWALDPRTNIIKDYIAGDGFHKDKITIHRTERALLKGDIRRARQDMAVERRFWHSGFIATLQEIGIIGLLFTFVVYIYAFIKVITIGSAIRNTPYFKYFLLYTSVFILSFLRFYLQTASTRTFMFSLCDLGFMKAFYTFAVENGDILIGKRKKYIPILIAQEQAKA